MKNQHNPAVTVALAVGALGLAFGGSSALAQTGGNPSQMLTAKDIFFRPTGTAPAQNRLLALNYKVLLQQGEDTVLVPPDHVFKRGDRFRLAVQANTSGYLYLLHKGTTGLGRFLFPDPRINGGCNHVDAYHEYVVPSTGWFEFDCNPGTETVHVILASEPLPQLVPLVGTDPIRPISWQLVVEAFVGAHRELQSGHGTKDIVYVEPGQDISLATIGQPSNVADETVPAGELEDPVAPTVQEVQASPTGPGVAENAPQAGRPTGGALSGGRPAGALRPQLRPSPRPDDQAIQVFVAQAVAPAGDRNLLVHTICLKHE